MGFYRTVGRASLLVLLTCYLLPATFIWVKTGFGAMAPELRVTGPLSIAAIKPVHRVDIAPLRGLQVEPRWWGHKNDLTAAGTRM